MSTEPVVGAELEQAQAALPALQRKPIIDSVPAEMLSLLAKRANAASKVEVTRPELAAFLELAAAYELDPFAGEVWLAKSGNDRVLIMVGRDGLRRIAQRNGLSVECDYICAADDFKVRRGQGGRMVDHSYGHPKERGELVGAWAQVRDLHANEVGFYVATVAEFKPTNEQQLRYSPWGSQASVMIMAAAERQALRQATPLAGLVAQGELDRGEEMAEGLPSREEEDERLNAVAAQFSAQTCRAILSVVDHARILEHAGLSDIGTLEMRLMNQPEEEAQRWLVEADAELGALARSQAEPPEAEVVPSEDTPESAAARAEELRAEANGLLDQVQELREAEQGDAADALEAEAEAKHAEADRLAPPVEQQEMPL